MNTLDNDLVRHGRGTPADVIAAQQAIRSRKGSLWVDGAKDGRQPWSARRFALIAAIPALALLALIAAIWGVRHIESAVQNDASARLADAGLTQAEIAAMDIDMSFRTANINGTLPAGFTRDEVSSIIEAGDARDVNFNLAAPEIVIEPDPTAEPTAPAVPDATPTPEATAEPTPAPTVEPTPTPADEAPDRDDDNLPTGPAPTTPPAQPVEPVEPAAVPTQAVDAVQQQVDLIAGGYSGDQLFVDGTAELAPAGPDALEPLVALLEENPDTVLTIEAYENTLGSDFENVRLSLLRAMTIRDHLVDAGIDPDRLEAVGRGDNGPRADGAARDGRRIELLVARAF